MEYNLFQRIQISFIKLSARLRWKQKYRLTPEDLEILKDRCVKDYYIIATRKSSYFSTFLIALGNFLLTGKWGFYSHVLMNLEDEVEIKSDFRFIEATGDGTHYSTFTGVFNKVDSVALIKPKSMTIEEWTAALDHIKVYLGVPYDNLFNLKNTLEINCVELIRLALQNLPDYETRFANFEKLVAKKKKLTPDMFAECEDFEVVLTINRRHQ